MGRSCPDKQKGRPTFVESTFTVSYRLYQALFSYWLRASELNRVLRFMRPAGCRLPGPRYVATVALGELVVKSHETICFRRLRLSMMISFPSRTTASFTVPQQSQYTGPSFNIIAPPIRQFLVPALPAMLLFDDRSPRPSAGLVGF